MQRIGARSLAGRVRRDERGTVVVLIALSVVMLLTFVALVVDLGQARQYRRQAQAAVDAAALAGAQQLAAQPLSWAGVVAQVKNYAANNAGVAFSAWSTCADRQALGFVPPAAGGGTCVSSDSASNPTRLRVRLPVRLMPAVFALASSGVRVSASATAAVSSGTVSFCAVCVLSPSDSPALRATGNGGVTVTNGGVLVNSTVSPAATLSGGGGLTAAWIGGPTAPGGFRGTGYVPAPVSRPAIPDPLAQLPMCPAAGTPLICPTTKLGNVTLGSKEARTLSPGVYGAISAGAGSSLTLLPGTYIITGGLSLTGDVSLQAARVTLYFACSGYPAPCAGGGEKGAGFSLTGTGALGMSAPTSGPFKGVVVFFDRNNTTASSLSGNGGNPTSGTLYMKSAALSLTGTGSSSTLNSMIVVNSLTASGNGRLEVAYSAALNAVITGVSLIQ